MIPNDQWGTAGARRFLEAVSIDPHTNVQTQTQKFLCYECILKGVKTAPLEVVFYKGSTYCLEHVV